MNNNQAIVVKDNHKLIYSYDDLEEHETIIEQRYKEKINLYENALYGTYELNDKLIKEVKILKISLAILFICLAVLGVNL